MGFYLSPLVDINEIDLTTTIPAVASSIAVNVLRYTWKGPEKKVQLITNIDELIDIFGEPETRSYQDILTCTGYLKYGNKLYCTRVMPDGATLAGGYITLATEASATSAADSTFAGYSSATAYTLDDLTTGDPDEMADEASLLYGTGQPAENASMVFTAKSRGIWGNYLKIAVVGKDIYESVLNGQAVPSISTELYNDLVDTDAPLDTDKEFLVIVKLAQQKNVNQTVIPYSVVETLMVSTDERKVDDEGKNLFFDNIVNNDSMYIRGSLRSTVRNTDVNTIGTSGYFNLAGGIDTSDDYVADVVTAADIIEAYELYENSEDIDVNVFIDSNKPDAVKLALESIASSRKDAIAILDCLSSHVLNQSGQETTNLRVYRNVTLNINSSYAAIYGNWLEVYDKWAARYRWIPASGHIAGVIANTDDVSDPWFAPAGLNRAILGNIRRLAWNPNQGQRDILYKNGVNPIVSFTGQGKVVWGQKTLLAKSSAFNRINVRRLFMVMEKAISTAARYFLFEPNDAFTRLLIINMIEPFLRDVKSRRGIYDFLVVCDERNNTGERIDRNELWVDIYIKPTKAAEFIVLNFIATKTGASFTELIAAT